MYLGVPPFGQTVRTISEKIAIQDQVDFYPDGGYLPGYIDIEINGQGLLSTDVIAIDGVKVTLKVKANALDEFRSVAYWPVSLVDTYRKNESDARYLPLTGGQITGGVGIGGAAEAGSQLRTYNASGHGKITIETADAYQSFLNFSAASNEVSVGFVKADNSFRICQYGDLSANELMRVDTAGLFKMNSGYGSVASVYGCRAWVNFNGTGTVAIQASGNVSSITDQGVGLYKVNFSTAMPDVNYAMSGSMEALSGNNVVAQYTDGGSGTAATSGNKGTTGCQIITSGGSLTDAAEISAIFVR
jgi:hypothetical protein